MRILNRIKTHPALAAGLIVVLLGAIDAYPDAYGFAMQLLSKGTRTGRSYVADDKPVALVVKYVGSSTSGKVAVDAGTGDLTFTDGAEGSEAANSDFECPVSGALGGVIDVSNAACDTLGEVVDTINGTCSTCAGTSSKWRAFILDGRREDSSNDTLVTIAATAATAEEGLNLVTDTDVAFTDTTSFQLCRTMSCMLTNRSGPVATIGLVENPAEGLKTLVWETSYTSTYGSGTSLIKLYSCETKQRVTGGSETCTEVYTAAGGATTANATKSWTTWGFPPEPDKRYLTKLVNSAAAATITASNYATVYPYR